MEVQEAGLGVGVAVLEKTVQADFVEGVAAEGRDVVLVHLEDVDVGDMSVEVGLVVGVVEEVETVDKVLFAEPVVCGW